MQTLFLTYIKLSWLNGVVSGGQEPRAARGGDVGEGISLELELLWAGSHAKLFLEELKRLRFKLLAGAKAFFSYPRR